MFNVHTIQVADLSASFLLTPKKVSLYNTRSREDYRVPINRLWTIQTIFCTWHFSAMEFIYIRRQGGHLLKYIQERVLNYIQGSKYFSIETRRIKIIYSKLRHYYNFPGYIQEYFSFGKHSLLDRRNIIDSHYWTCDMNKDIYHFPL